MGDSVTAGLINENIQRLKGIYEGVVPPGWFMYPDIHPYSIGWRMGSGEWHNWAFYEWWEKEGSNMTEDQRIEFFHRFPPPARWLLWMIEMLWDLDSNDTRGFGGRPIMADLDGYFQRAEDLGFGTKADFERDINDTGNGGGTDDEDDEDESSSESEKSAGPGTRE